MTKCVLATPAAAAAAAAAAIMSTVLVHSRRLAAVAHVRARLEQLPCAAAVQRWVHECDALTRQIRCGAVAPRRCRRRPRSECGGAPAHEPPSPPAKRAKKGAPPLPPPLPGADATSALARLPACTDDPRRPLVVVTRRDSAHPVDRDALATIRDYVLRATTTRQPPDAAAAALPASCVICTESVLSRARFVAPPSHRCAIARGAMCTRCTATLLANAHTANTTARCPLCNTPICQQHVRCFTLGAPPPQPPAGAAPPASLDGGGGGGGVQ